MFATCRQRQCDSSVCGEVTDELEVIVAEWRLTRVACDSNYTHHRVVRSQRHDDRRSFADIGESLDRILEGTSNQRNTATRNTARGGALHRNLLTDHLRGVPAGRGGHDKGVDVMRGQIGLPRNQQDRLLSIGQLQRPVHDDLQWPRLRVAGQQRGRDLATSLRPFRRFVLSLEESRVVDGGRSRSGQCPYGALLEVGKYSVGLVVGQVKAPEVSCPHGDRYCEECPQRRIVCVQSGGLRMSTEIIDANTIAYRQIAEPPRRVVVDSHVDERSEGAVGRAYTQCSVPGTGQLHRRIDDSPQRHIQVQNGTDLDDDPHELFHLVARCR